MILYRALKIDGYFPKPEKMGIYWTGDHNQAFPYGHKEQIDDYYIYTAKIAHSSIDIAATAKMSYGMFSYEKEVVMKPNEEIEVIRIEWVKLFAPMKVNDVWLFKKETQLINTNFKTRT